MIRKTIVALAALPLCLASVATAQSAPASVYVFGEDDDEDSATCRVTYASIIAAVRAALRYNRLLPVQDDNGADMIGYVNIVTNSLASGNCAVHLSLQFYKFGTTTNPVTKKRAFVKHLFCDKGGLLTWDKAGAQAKINEAMRQFTDECIDEIEKNST